MIPHPWFWALAIPAVALTGISKGGLGGGAAVATPLIALTIPPAQAAATAAILTYRLIYALLFLTGTKLSLRRSDRTMTAYWVARSKINDPVQYKKYTDRVPAILQRYGGRVLARGGRFKVLEGPEKFQRFVVVEFPSFEQALACHQSPEYQEAAAFRKDGAGEVEIAIVEGGEATK